MTGITRGWPPARRRQQAENIRKTKPWKKATGPKTTAGKAVSKNNAYKHGWRSEDIRAVYRLLRMQRRFVKQTLNRDRGEAANRRGDPQQQEVIGLPHLLRDAPGDKREKAGEAHDPL